MAVFTFNQHTDYYEAMDGGHSIYIADDTFMLQLEELQRAEGMSEQEALTTLDDIGWWYDHLPLSGVFIDGLEQTDEAHLYSRRAEMYLCRYCGQYHPTATKEWLCPLAPKT